jgi:hypothetical protein
MDSKSNLDSPQTPFLTWFLNAFLRRYYELCVMAELKNALRSGDIWVQGSRQFKDFEDYLLSRDRFTAMRAAHELRLAIDTESKVTSPNVLIDFTMLSRV